MAVTERIRAPRRDAAANREALMLAARELLNRDPGASLEAIAARAGLSRRAVYGHFPTRDALLAAVTETGAARFIGAVVSTPPDVDPLVELASLGIVIWDDVSPVRVMTQATLRDRADQVAPALDALRDRATAVLDRARDAGLVRTDLPVSTVYRLLEGAAFAVLDEANREPITDDAGRRLLLLAVFGAVGLSWREAEAFLGAHPALLAGDRQSRPAPHATEQQ